MRCSGLRLARQALLETPLHPVSEDGQFTLSIEPTSRVPSLFREWHSIVAAKLRRNAAAHMQGL